VQVETSGAQARSSLERDAAQVGTKRRKLDRLKLLHKVKLRLYNGSGICLALQTYNPISTDITYFLYLRVCSLIYPSMHNPSAYIGSAVAIARSGNAYDAPARISVLCHRC